jgi:hypothetical protein
MIILIKGGKTEKQIRQKWNNKCTLNVVINVTK